MIIEALKYMSIRVLGFFAGIVIFCIAFSFIIGRCTSPEPKEIVKIDTVYVDKIVKQSVIVEDDEPEKPIPAITKFKVTDWVCAWDRWSGVIISISWSEKNPNVLVYEVQTYDDEEGTWVQNEYYDTELTLGKCH